MAARTVTKNSINTKMTISQEPLVEIDPTLFHDISNMKPFFFFFFFCILAFQDGRHLPFTKISAEQEIDIISTLMDF